MRQVVPNWRYTHISEDVRPPLRQRGVTGEQITTMLADNPRRYFDPTAAGVCRRSWSLQAAEAEQALEFTHERTRRGDP